MGRQTTPFLIRVYLTPESIRQASGYNRWQPNAAGNFCAYKPLLVAGLLKFGVWKLGCPVLWCIIMCHAGVSSASKESHFTVYTAHHSLGITNLYFENRKKGEIFVQKGCCFVSSSSQKQGQLSYCIPWASTRKSSPGNCQWGANWLSVEAAVSPSLPLQQALNHSEEPRLRKWCEYVICTSHVYSCLRREEQPPHCHRKVACSLVTRTRKVGHKVLQAGGLRARDRTYLWSYPRVSYFLL